VRGGRAEPSAHPWAVGGSGVDVAFAFGIIKFVSVAERGSNAGTNDDVASAVSIAGGFTGAECFPGCANRIRVAFPRCGIAVRGV